MKDIPKLGKVVNKNTKAVFQFYRAGELWYDVIYEITYRHIDDGYLGEIGKKVFSFPVPIEDTGTALFKKEDKSIVFMKWIRKQIKTLEEI